MLGIYQEVASDPQYKSEGGKLKPKGWTKVTSDFNEACDVQYSKDQVKSKFYSIQEDYDTWKWLMEQSGGGDDGDFPDDVWEKIIQKKPHAAKFRDNPMDPEMIR